MAPIINRYKWFAVCLVLGVFLLAFWRPIMNGIGNGLTPVKPVPTPVISNPAFRPLIDAHFCVDGPNWYPASSVKLAETAVANATDSLVTANSGGVNLWVSYIDSTSFQHTALTIKVPAIPPIPVPPVKPNKSDPYKQAAAMTTYKSDYAVWQVAYTSWQNQFTVIRSNVMSEAGALAALPPHIDNSGSSIWGCLFTASLNFQGVKAHKVLLIASTMQDNQPEPIPTGFTLAGVTVEIIFHNCITSASVCAQNDENWKQIFKRYGVSSMSFATVQESAVSPISL